MHSPSWLLLAWSGAAATVAATLFGTAVGGGRPAAWSLAPHVIDAAAAARWHALLGLAVYPALYGILFELLGRADIRLGILTGAIHGLATLLFTTPRRHPARAARIASAHVLYAVILAWLYITP